MSRILFEGACPALICPMDKDGNVDYEAFERHVLMQLEGGVSAVVVNGTTGEASTLTAEEKIELVKRAVKIVNHKVPVIAGAGSNNTAAAIKAALEAKEAGADALLLVTPYYNKASQKGLIQHYEAIVNAAQLPTILYTVPSRTGQQILPETVATLAKNPYIVGLKDAVGSLPYTIDVLAKTKDLDFAVYSGEDRLGMAAIMLGCKGVISVTCDALPKGVSAMCKAALAGDIETAKKMMFDLDLLSQLLFKDVNPIPIKAIGAHMGLGANMLRLPLCPCDEALEAQLNATYDALKERGY